MPNTQSQALTGELIKRLSVFDQDNQPSEFEAKLFMREADKLKNVNLSEGWMMAGIVHAILFQYEDTKCAFEKSLFHSPDDFEATVLNYVRALQGLGRFEEALEIIEKYVIDSSAKLLRCAVFNSVNLGLFDKARNYSQKLVTFPAVENIYLDYINDLTVAFNEQGISEADCSAVHLIVMDAIHQSKKALIKRTIRENHEDNSLILLFYINADADTLADIGFAIIEKLAESEIKSISEKRITPLVLKGAN